MSELNGQNTQECPTIAILSSIGEYTTFSVGDKTITFLTSKNLDRYTEVVEWDKGYIVVMCRMKNRPDEEREDYIDLVPILKNLHIDPIGFLKPIKEVHIEYPENEIIATADAADMIVRGYAFTRKGETISVLNLNRPMCAMVIDHTGKMLESSMDPIEQAVVLKIWETNSKFMGVTMP